MNTRNTRNIPNGAKNSAQKGFTLIELLVALLTIAVLTALAVAVYNNVRQTSDVDREVKNFQQITSTTRQVYSSARTYGAAGAALTGVINNAGGFPQSMIATSACGTNVPHNQWNGCVTVAVGTATSTFNITYTEVPAARCVALLGALASGLNSYQVGTGTVRAGLASMTAANFSADCGSAGPVQITLNAS